MKGINSVICKKKMFCSVLFSFVNLLCVCVCMCYCYNTPAHINNRSLMLLLLAFFFLKSSSYFLSYLNRLHYIDDDDFFVVVALHIDKKQKNLGIAASIIFHSSDSILSFEYLPSIGSCVFVCVFSVFLFFVL